jgi:hypothetical protein
VVGLSYEEPDANALVATRKQTEKEASREGVEAQTDKLTGWELVKYEEEEA